MSKLFEFLFSIISWPFDVISHSIRNILSGKAYSGSSYGLSDILMYHSFVDDGIIIQTDGSFLSAYFFRGSDVETSTSEELEVISAQLSHAFSTLGNNWMFQVDTIRYESSKYTQKEDSCFPNIITKLIDEERRKIYESETLHYENAYAISFTYKPKIDFGSKVGLFFRRNDGNKEFDYSYYLDQYKNKINEIISYLNHNLAISKMSDTELASYISWALTSESVVLNLPKKAKMFLKQYLGSQDLIGGDAPKIGKKYFSAVTIMGFPPESYPGIMDRLNYVGFEYRWNTRFILLDQYEASSIIDKISSLWYQKRISAMDTIKMSLAIDSNIKVNQNAEAQYIDAESAKALNDSGNARYGFYTATVIIMDKDPKKLEQNAEIIRSEFKQLGFQSKIENSHSVEAFLGSLPGSSYANIRKWIIHTLNVADIVPSTSIWSGYLTNQCPYYRDNNPPLFYARTTGYTPLRVSLHNNENGNTLIVGSSINDKVKLMNFIIAQHFRYKSARVFVFDFNRMTLPLCHACGGNFYDIGTDNNSVNFQPLAQLENDLDFEFAATWIEELCIINKMGTEFNDTHRQAIRKALRLMQKEAPRDRRTISYFRHLVQDFDKAVSDLLDAFTQEARTINDTEKNGGFRSKIFDSNEDKISTENSNFSSFEMSKLMEVGEGVAIPALRYLIHAISKQIYKSQPTLIVFNESFILFKNPIIREKLIEWFKSVVTYNVAIVFTININDISKYVDLKKDLNAICTTKFFTPNNKAMTEDVYPLYKDMLLNHRQIEIISQLFEGNYLYFCDAGKRVFSLDIDKRSATAAFTACTEVAQIQKASDIYNEVGGDMFIDKWLAEYNVSNWAINKLHELRKQNQEWL